MFFLIQIIEISVIFVVTFISYIIDLNSINTLKCSIKHKRFAKSVKKIKFLFIFLQKGTEMKDHFAGLAAAAGRVGHGSGLEGFPAGFPLLSHMQVTRLKWSKHVTPELEKILNDSITKLYPRLIFDIFMVDPQPPFGLHPFDPRLPFSSVGAFRPIFGNSAAAAAAAAAAVAVSVANSNDSNNSRFETILKHSIVITYLIIQGSVF